MKWGAWFLGQLQKPHRIFFVCLGFTIVSMILNHSFVNLFSLRRDYSRINEQIEIEKSRINELDVKLKKARDPSYIERQAMDKLDMVDERDLVFVFSDE